MSDHVMPDGRPARATGGMVSSAHPLATEAGLDILSTGGNAFDAAVAIAATLNVVEPMMSGIGGYGTILTYDAGRRQCQFLDASGRIPLAVDSDAFRPPTPNHEANRRGAMAVSTPGNLRAWQALAHKGRLVWSELLGAATRLATNGFAVDGRLAGFIADSFPVFPPHAQAIYGFRGRPLAEGQQLVQADLGRSLARIAEQGPDDFYRGALGRTVIAAVQEANGFLASVDLEQHAAEWWEPICLTYRGHKVCTASPPATSFPALIRLGLMSRFDCRALGHNTLDYLHLFAEVTKQAYQCRLVYAADPEILIDFDMDIQAAIAAPRISFAEPDTLLVEEWIAAATRQALQAKGHAVQVPERGVGNAHGLTLSYDRGGTVVGFAGGADSRGVGLARGPQ